MRLLGDLAFLSQNYDLAYACYHSCKRDFQNDHAWLYYAGALVGRDTVVCTFYAAALLFVSRKWLLPLCSCKQ